MSGLGALLLYSQFTHQDSGSDASIHTQHFSPDQYVLATPFGQSILDARDLSRLSPTGAEQALLELDKMDAFGDDATLKAYRLMIESNIASNQHEHEKVRSIGEQLAAMAKAEGLEWLLAESQAEMAIEAYLIGDLTKAQQLIDSAIAYADSINYHNAQIKNYNTAGVISSTQGEFLLAQEYFHYGLELAKTIPDHDYHPKLISNMALIYIFLEDWSKALSLIEQGKAFYVDSGSFSPTAEIILHTNEAYVQYHLGNVIAAREAYQRGLSVFESERHSKRTELVVLRTESDILWLEKSYSAARKVADKCISIADHKELPLEVGLCYLSRAKADSELGFHAHVVEDLLQALTLIEQADAHSWEMEIHKELAKTYEMFGNHPKALEHHKLYYKQNKALLFDRRQSELFVLQESFETNSLLQQAALAESETAVAKLKVDKQRLRNWTVIAFTFVVLMSFIQIRKRANSTQQENKLLAKLHQQDPLTGLGNRRYIDKWLEENYQLNQNYYIALIDIDDFKFINDNYGHDIGDQVIIETANRLRNEIADEDAIVRWGGEEFLIVLNHNGDPKVRLKKMVRAISTRRYPTKEANLHITVSVGTSYLCGALTNEKNLETAIKQADRALYGVKSEGKNHVQQYDATKHAPRTCS